MWRNGCVEKRDSDFGKWLVSVESAITKTLGKIRKDLELHIRTRQDVRG